MENVEQERLVGRPALRDRQGSSAMDSRGGSRGSAGGWAEPEDEAKREGCALYGRGFSHERGYGIFPRRSVGSAIKFQVLLRESEYFVDDALDGCFKIALKSDRIALVVDAGER